MTPTKLAEKYRKIIKEKLPEIKTAHDERGHWYILPNGVKTGSVTKELQTLKDEGLMNYKMNRALGFVKPILMTGTAPGNWGCMPEDYEGMADKIIEQAKLVPVKEFEGAGDIGRQVHNWREMWFHRMINDMAPEIFTPCAYPEDADPAVISGCRAINKFIKETGYVPIATEIPIALSEKQFGISDREDIGLGGTFDDLGILPGEYKVPTSDPTLGDGYKVKFKPRLVFIDLKTSNIGDKTSYFLQVALYYYMFKKLTGINVKEFYILHVSKTDGTYKLIPIKNMPQLIRDAKTLLKLNRSLARIGEEKKKEAIII